MNSITLKIYLNLMCFQKAIHICSMFISIIHSEQIIWFFSSHLLNRV